MKNVWQMIRQSTFDSNQVHLSLDRSRAWRRAQSRTVCDATCVQAVVRLLVATCGTAAAADDANAAASRCSRRNTRAVKKDLPDERQEAGSCANVGKMRGSEAGRENLAKCQRRCQTLFFVWCWQGFGGVKEASGWKRAMRNATRCRRARKCARGRWEDGG